MKNLLPLMTAIFVLFSCQDSEKTVPREQVKMESQDKKALTKTESIKRGEYLVTLMDCNVCHTPKTMGPQGPQWIEGKMLSGYPSDATLPDENTNYSGMGLLMKDDGTASSGPWGTSFASNLTPHETGIGTWSLDQFELAMRHGKFKGMENSRPLLPPMPWQAYSALTDEDLAAIFNYLKSIPAVDNVVPPPTPPNGAPGNSAP